jgi:glycosyltransferase involved in cell wall biosynthesis
VRFAGHVNDGPGIWQTHQALVRPSRQEGLPLALVEAMLCGRPAIATDVGGIAELLVDGETGFLAAAPTVGALDAALERAWSARTDWPRLGAQAARRARATVPADPAAHFAEELLLRFREATCSGSSGRSSS